MTPTNRRRLEMQRYEFEDDVYAEDFEAELPSYINTKEGQELAVMLRFFCDRHRRSFTTEELIPAVEAVLSAALTGTEMRELAEHLLRDMIESQKVWASTFDLPPALAAAVRAHIDERRKARAMAREAARKEAEQAAAAEIAEIPF
jgi:hypothetical protein